MVTHMGFEPMNVALRGRCVNHFTNGPCIKYIIILLIFKYFLHLISVFGKNIIGEIMNNKEYDELVKSIIKQENPIKNILIAFISGGLIGMLTEFMINIILKVLNFIHLKRQQLISLLLVIYQIEIILIHLH